MFAHLKMVDKVFVLHFRLQLCLHLILFLYLHPPRHPTLHSLSFHLFLLYLLFLHLKLLPLHFFPHPLPSLTYFSPLLLHILILSSSAIPYLFPSNSCSLGPLLPLPLISPPTSTHSTSTLYSKPHPSDPSLHHLLPPLLPMSHSPLLLMLWCHLWIVMRHPDVWCHPVNALALSHISSSVLDWCQVWNGAAIMHSNILSINIEGAQPMAGPKIFWVPYD